MPKGVYNTGSAKLVSLDAVPRFLDVARIGLHGPGSGLTKELPPSPMPLR